MKVQTGMILENKLANGSIVVVRVLGWIESVQMWRVTDARETKSDAWLIENQRTWAVPIENLVRHDADCMVCHEQGLIYFGGH